MCILCLKAFQFRASVQKYPTTTNVSTVRNRIRTRYFSDVSANDCPVFHKAHFSQFHNDWFHMHRCSKRAAGLSFLMESNPCFNTKQGPQNQSYVQNCTPHKGEKICNPILLRNYLLERKSAIKPSLIQDACWISKRRSQAIQPSRAGLVMQTSKILYWHLLISFFLFLTDFWQRSKKTLCNYSEHYIRSYNGTRRRKGHLTLL